MRRDAVARLEVVLAVLADLRVARVAAAEPARPLLAAVVPAARVLAEVAADRALVAQERRGRQPGRGRDGGVGRERAPDEASSASVAVAPIRTPAPSASMPPRPASWRSTRSDGGA